MSLELSVWLVIALMVVGANLPFVNQRVFVIGPRRDQKSLGLRLLELVVFYALVGAAALAVEQSLGQIYPQRWEFYATTFALFVTLGFPGFVYRYLVRR